MDVKNIFKNIRIYLLITASIGLFLVSAIMCTKDDCTKLVNKQRISAGTSLKTTSTKSSVADTTFIPSSQDNPIWLDWWNKDSIKCGVHSGSKLNAMNEYVANSWAGMRETITINEGDRLYISSTNFVVNGDIIGNGKIELDGSPLTLVVRGFIDNTITIEQLTDGHTIQQDVPLDDNTVSTTGYKYTVTKPCSFTVPNTVLEDGKWWIYTEYDGTGVREGTSLYKQKL